MLALNLISPSKLYITLRNSLILIFTHQLSLGCEGTGEGTEPALDREASPSTAAPMPLGWSASEGNLRTYRNSHAMAKLIC